MHALGEFVDWSAFNQNDGTRRGDLILLLLHLFGRYCERVRYSFAGRLGSQVGLAGHVHQRLITNGRGNGEPITIVAKAKRQVAVAEVNPHDKCKRYHIV